MADLRKEEVDAECNEDSVDAGIGNGVRIGELKMKKVEEGVLGRDNEVLQRKPRI